MVKHPVTTTLPLALPESERMPTVAGPSVSGQAEDLPWEELATSHAWAPTGRSTMATKPQLAPLTLPLARILCFTLPNSHQAIPLSRAHLCTSV
jgi:hypothetical protein